MYALVCSGFSKDLAADNNLSCLLVLPPYQKEGWGQFLIHVSHVLGRREGRALFPQGPVSASAQRAYATYYKRELLKACPTCTGPAPQNRQLS